MHCFKVTYWELGQNTVMHVYYLDSEARYFTRLWTEYLRRVYYTAFVFQACILHSVRVSGVYTTQRSCLRRVCYTAFVFQACMLHSVCV